MKRGKMFVGLCLLAALVVCVPARGVDFQEQEGFCHKVEPISESLAKEYGLGYFLLLQ